MTTPAKPADVSFTIGGGRDLPKLLFVTNRQALSRSAAGAGGQLDSLLASLRSKGHAVFDTPAGGAAADLAKTVHEQTRAANPAGIVILGGYDVVPPAILDVLDPPLRRSLRQAIVDLDNFVVWNDDLYADADGDGFPELPVSRIPDGRSFTLLKSAIAAPASLKPAAWQGLRNEMRPFADNIWNAAAPGHNLLQAPPTFPTQNPRLDMSGSQVYYMLHGSDRDATRFWGETPDGLQPEAFNLDNVPDDTPFVVFTGCCWAALVADAIASRASTSSPPRPKTPDNSIALRYLQRGAGAFVGCTGSHYSPNPPGSYYGGPMHRAFWSYLNAGKPPAQALFLAKKDYRQAMPHGVTSAQSRAIEKKILWQYTCLGLGW